MKRCAPLWRWRLVDDVLKVVTGATCLCRCCCCWDGSVSRKIIILHINHIENKHSVCVCVHTTHHVMAWVNIISVEGATQQLWLISKSTWNMTHWIIFKHSFKMKAKVKWSQQFSAELQVYIIHNMSSNLKVQRPIVSSEQALGGVQWPFTHNSRTWLLQSTTKAAANDITTYASCGTNIRHTNKSNWETQMKRY